MWRHKRITKKVRTIAATIVELNKEYDQQHGLKTIIDHDHDVLAAGGVESEMEKKARHPSLTIPSYVESFKPSKI